MKLWPFKSTRMLGFDDPPTNVKHATCSCVIHLPVLVGSLTAPIGSLTVAGDGKLSPPRNPVQASWQY